MVFYLSPSTINLFKECPHCFWLKFRADIPRPDTIFPSLPSGIDRVLKDYFDKFRERGELPPELKSLEGFKLFDKMDFLKKWRDGFGIAWRDPKGNVIRGKVDELLVHDGKLAMIDFKTKGSAPHENSHTYYLDQLNIYAWLFEKNGFFVENRGFLVFYHPELVGDDGKFRFVATLREIEINTRDAEKLITDALNTLKGEPPKSAETCSFCNWKKKVTQFEKSA